MPSHDCPLKGAEGAGYSSCPQAAKFPSSAREGAARLRRGAAAGSVRAEGRGPPGLALSERLPPGGQALDLARLALPEARGRCLDLPGSPSFLAEARCQDLSGGSAKLARAPGRRGGGPELRRPRLRCCLSLREAARPGVPARPPAGPRRAAPRANAGFRFPGRRDHRRSGELSAEPLAVARPVRVCSPRSAHGAVGPGQPPTPRRTGSWGAPPARPRRLVERGLNRGGGSAGM